MMNRTAVAATVALVCLSAAVWSQAAPPEAAYAPDPGSLELVATAGATAELGRIGPEQGGPGTRVSYDKAGDERRLLALEARPGQPLPVCRALALRYRLSPAEGTVARLAALVWERGGGVWFRSGNPVAAAAEPRECRLSLQGMRQAAFSTDASGQLEWDQVERVWIGFMVDGKGRGSFELSKVALTPESYRATEPVSLFRPDPAQWSVGADPAVKGHTLEAVEIEGAPCLRLRFRFPGGRHMYYVPAQALPEMEYSAYEGLRFTYRATLPPGLSGLLVCAVESGGQFVATPAPAATGDWESVTVPWTAFPLGAWSKDDNGRLDVDAIERVCFGSHGTAQGEGGDGEILIRDIEAVPAGQ